jgi:hypothetical protein
MSNSQLTFISTFIGFYLLLNILFISSDSSKFWGYFFIFLSVLIGIICGVIVQQIYKLGIVCAGVASGFFLSILLNLMFLFRIESNPSFVSTDTYLIGSAYFKLGHHLLGHSGWDNRIRIRRPHRDHINSIHRELYLYKGFVSSHWTFPKRIPVFPKYKKWFIEIFLDCNFN